MLFIKEESVEDVAEWEMEDLQTSEVVDDPPCSSSSALKTEPEAELPSPTEYSRAKEKFAGELAGPSEVDDIQLEKSNEGVEINAPEVRSNNAKRKPLFSYLKKSYTCFTCGYISKRKAPLIDHVRVHTGEKPYKCDVCKSRFIQASNLRTHIMTHTGERPYICDVCKSRFRQAGNLKAHKRIHTGEKPFKCDACESRFRRSDTLKAHLLIHAGVKPYVCNVCRSRFRQLTNLMRHKRSSCLGETF